MAPDSISERANFPGGACPQTSLVGRVLHVPLAPPTVHLLRRPCKGTPPQMCKIKEQQENSPEMLIYV